jgi:hypothetical protein
MKPFERITLVAVVTAYSGYLIHHAARARADERCCRLAAGESAFERTRSGIRQGSTAPKPRSFNGRSVAKS